ncbi:hypothetical protein JWG39_13595 [Desulforhopalus vacuolatus]|uniref:hypothetical protein n=1 Tax=Desulforhopalus vacuolatus TaxID=40414 RepID=UPI001966A2C4|nr:hypothetical protein [Desulforhopalus vacuolatus]MBM9520850.1 hypothetical protein [Desulforhopalus vacuolatus]
MKKKKIFSLKDDEICKLFDRFSHPITKSAITESQKNKASEIIKILWLLFITGTDSEENVYKILNYITSNNHESNIGIGSLYYHKMKKSLTTVEILRIRNHYKSLENFNKLEEWGISPQILNNFH